MDSTAATAGDLIRRRSGSRASAAPWSDAPKGRKKFNSCSTIYVDSTVLKPDRDDAIYCVALAIYYGIEAAKAVPDDQRVLFDVFDDSLHPIVVRACVRAAVAGRRPIAARPRDTAEQKVGTLADAGSGAVTEESVRRYLRALVSAADVRASVRAAPASR